MFLSYNIQIKGISINQVFTKANLAFRLFPKERSFRNGPCEIIGINTALTRSCLLNNTYGNFITLFYTSRFFVSFAKWSISNIQENPQHKAIPKGDYCNLQLEKVHPQVIIIMKLANNDDPI